MLNIKHILITILNIISLIAFCFYSQAQTKTVSSKTFGGPKADQIYWLEQTSDKGFIAAGVTKSFGTSNSDAWLIRVNKKGDTLWTKTYGGINDDFAEGVLQTRDAGFIFTGGTKSYGSGNTDVWVVRTDKLGDTLWTKTFGGSNDDWGEEIHQTSDGGFIIPGWTTSSRGDNDALLIKLNNKGGFEWSRIYGGTKMDAAKSVVALSDGYIIAGVTKSFGAGDADAWIIRTNLSGDTLWTRTFGGKLFDMPFCIIQTSNKNFAFSGRTSSYGYPEGNVWLQIINNQGDSLLSKTYGGKDYEVATFIQQTSDKGFILSGISKSFGVGNFEAYIIKTNKFGDTLWTQTFGGPLDDYSYTIKQIGRHGFIFSGSTKSFGTGESDGWILRLRTLRNKPR